MKREVAPRFPTAQVDMSEFMFVRPAACPWPASIAASSVGYVQVVSRRSYELPAMLFFDVFQARVEHFFDTL